MTATRPHTQEIPGEDTERKVPSASHRGALGISHV